MATKKIAGLLYGDDNSSVQIVIDGITQPDVYKWRDAAMQAVKKLFEDGEIEEKNAQQLYDQIIMTEGMTDDEHDEEETIIGIIFGHPTEKMIMMNIGGMSIMTISMSPSFPSSNFRRPATFPISVTDTNKGGSSSMIAMFMEELFDDELFLESTVTPVFKLCPNCGKHGGFLFSKGKDSTYEISSSVRSKKQAMVSLKYYQENSKTPLSEPDVVRLTEEVEKCSLPDELVGNPGLNDTDFVPEIFK